jgi:hypothetical protein
MTPQKPRRIVLINPRYQLRLAAAFLVVQLVLTGLFAGGLYLFLDSELHASLASAHAQAQSLERMLLPIVLVLSCFSLAFSTVLVTLFVVFLTHKVAGPIYRFRSALESLAGRDLGAPTAIRPEDQLEEVAHSMREAFATLATDFGTLGDAATEARRSAEAAGDTATLAAVAKIEGVLSAWRKPA